MENTFNIQGALSGMNNPTYVHNTSTGYCAKSVRLFIESAGISTEGHPDVAYKYADYLPSIGFSAIAELTGNDKQSEWSNWNAQVGDIAVIKHGKNGHICMWNGNQWVSDYKQSKMNPYSNDVTAIIYRFNNMNEEDYNKFINGLSSWLNGYNQSSTSSTNSTNSTSSTSLLDNYFTLPSTSTVNFNIKKPFTYKQSTNYKQPTTNLESTQFSKFFSTYQPIFAKKGTKMIYKAKEGDKTEDEPNYRTMHYNPSGHWSDFYIDKDTGQYVLPNGIRGSFVLPEVVVNNREDLEPETAKFGYERPLLSLPSSSFFRLSIPGQTYSKFFSSPELLDLIAEDYSKLGIPLIYTLGHIYQEQTGVRENRLKHDQVKIDPHVMVNYYHPYLNLDILTYNDAWEKTLEKYKNLYEHTAEALQYQEDMFKKLRYERYPYALKQIQAEKPSQSYFGGPGVRFKNKQYNSGDPNYYKKVERGGRYMLQVPGVQEWLKTQTYYSTDPQVMEKELRDFNSNVLHLKRGGRLIPKKSR